MMPDVKPDISGVANFDQKRLKHVETEEKTVLPSTKGTGRLFI
jgi:hypothetical protein